MPEYTGTVETPKSVEEAFRYMEDFTHTPEWDSNCETAEKTTPGEIGPGTEFRLVFKLGAGQTLDLRYKVTEHSPPHKMVIEGGNDSLKSTDTVEVRPSGAGAQVTYTTEVELTGAMKLLNPSWGWPSPAPGPTRATAWRGC